MLTFRHAAYLPRALQSLLAQKVKDWRLIAVIDDEDFDSTADVIRRYLAGKDLLLIPGVRRGAAGIPANYTRAERVLEAEYVAFLEGDDAWPKDKLSIQLKALLEDPRVVCSYGMTMIMNERNEPLGLLQPTAPQSVLLNSPSGSLGIAMISNGPHTLPFPVSSIVRRSALSTTGFVHVPGVPFVDYPTMLQLTLQGPFAYRPAVVGYWRRHSRQLTLAYSRSVYDALLNFALQWLAVNEAHFSRSGLRIPAEADVSARWQDFVARAGMRSVRRLMAAKRWHEARASAQALPSRGIRMSTAAAISLCKTAARLKIPIEWLFGLAGSQRMDQF